MPKIISMRRDDALPAIRQWLAAREDEMVASLREMVVRESPTHDKEACDQMCSYLAGEFEHLGGQVRIHRQRSAGNHLQVNFAGVKGRKPVLLLGHFDTVHDLGTLQRCHGASIAAVCYGPGVFDMKAGIVQMMFALRALREIARTTAEAGHRVAGVG